jgi:hypothetical protein
MEQSAILAEALKTARAILPGRGDDLWSEITTQQELERLFSEGSGRDVDKSSDVY